MTPNQMVKILDGQLKDCHADIEAKTARIAELEGKLKLAASALDEASEYSSGLKSYADNLRAALKVTT
jgi:hypothetical protein